MSFLPTRIPRLRLVALLLSFGLTLGGSPIARASEGQRFSLGLAAGGGFWAGLPQPSAGLRVGYALHKHFETGFSMQASALFDSVPIAVAEATTVLHLRLRGAVGSGFFFGILVGAGWIWINPGTSVSGTGATNGWNGSVAWGADTGYDLRVGSSVSVGFDVRYVVYPSELDASATLKFWI